MMHTESGMLAKVLSARNRSTTRSGPPDWPLVTCICYPDAGQAHTVYQSSPDAGFLTSQASAAGSVASEQRWRLQQPAANHPKYNRRSPTLSSAEPYTRLDWAHLTTTWLRRGFSCMGSRLCTAIALAACHGSSDGSECLAECSSYSRYPQITRDVVLPVLLFSVFVPFSTQPVSVVWSRQLFRGTIYQESRIASTHYGWTSIPIISSSSCSKTDESQSATISSPKASQSRTINNRECRKRQNTC